MCSSFAIGQTPRLFLKRNRLTINGTHMTQRDNSMEIPLLNIVEKAVQGFKDLSLKKFNNQTDSNVKVTCPQSYVIKSPP